MPGWQSGRGTTYQIDSHCWFALNTFCLSLIVVNTIECFVNESEGLTSLHVLGLVLPDFRSISYRHSDIDIILSHPTPPYYSSSISLLSLFLQHVNSWSVSPDLWSFLCQDLSPDDLDPFIGLSCACTPHSAEHWPRGEDVDSLFISCVGIQQNPNSTDHSCLDASLAVTVRVALCPLPEGSLLG